MNKDILYYRRNFEVLPGTLRAVAAFWVVIFHCSIVLSGATDSNWPKSNNIFNALIYEGWMAVSLFIVLSGYQLGKVLLTSKTNWPRFFFARLLRIYPLYVLAMICSYSVRKPPLETIMLDLLLIPRLPGQYCCATNFSATVWTVRVEFYLYLLLPILVFLLKKFGIKTLIFLDSLILVIGEYFPDKMGYFYWHLPGRFVEFSFGLIAAQIMVKRGSGKPRFFGSNLLKTAISVSIILTLTFWINRRGGEWMVGNWWPLATGALSLCFCLILISSSGYISKLNPLAVRSIIWISELSYGTYLFHFTVIGFLAPRVGFLMNGQTDAFQGALFGALLCFPISLFLAWVISPVEKFFMNKRPIYWS